MEELESLKGVVELKETVTETPKPAWSIKSLFSLTALRDSMKPWTEFLGPSSFARPGTNVCQQIKFNLTTYQGNYALVCCVILMLYL